MNSINLNFNFNKISENNSKFDEKQKIKVYSWEDVLEFGKANVIPAIPPKPEDTYIICHTSGTTGNSKGVELSHKAILTSSINGLYSQWCIPPSNFRISSNDVYISFLSPAHSYEQILQILMIYINGKIGVFSGNINNLMMDMKILRPTIVALVPRILDKFRQKILEDVQSFSLIQILFNIGLKKKIKKLENGIIKHDTIWDKLIFKNFVHKLFGGKLRLITTGGAPITKQTMNFSRVVYGCPVVEGYGQTECSAAGTLTLINDTTCRHVGGPSPWAQVKLIDVPDLGYYSKENKGEVCFRGAAIMTRYFKEPELTAQTIDKDGWLHTGDIGEWLENGSLQIIDRKRHFFKLSQGDFVAPEQVEDVYSQHSSIKQIFVTGYSTESYLVAIAVLNPSIINFIKKNFNNTELKTKNEDTIETILNSDKYEYRKNILNDLRKFGQVKGLSKLEQISNIYLTDKEFLLNSDFITPTLKLQRVKMNAYFAPIIKKLYKEGSLKN